jgi:hypothetical protein
MNRGPQSGRSTVDHSARAQVAWNNNPPVEITALAEACNRRSAAAVARDLGYSPAVVSQLIANKYPGDVARVIDKIRGLLLGETVDCPVLGELARHRCLDEQRKPFSTSSSTRVRLYHACRTCPNAGGK